MAVKVIDTNEFIYVGQVNSKGLMVSQKDKGY